MAKYTYNLFFGSNTPKNEKFEYNMNEILGISNADALLYHAIILAGKIFQSNISFLGMERRWNTNILFLCRRTWRHDCFGFLQQIQQQLYKTMCFLVPV